VVSGSLAAVLVAEALIIAVHQKRLMTRFALPFRAMDVSDLHREVDVDRAE
jgi:hypothetical protein